jgi:anti-sigma factor RsiW
MTSGREEMASDETIRRYLLGLGTDEEAEALEARYFEDPEQLAHVRALESELLDAYVRGALPPSERAQIERRYAETPALAERLAFARALSRALGAGDRRRTRAWGPLAIAASTLLALATTGLLADRARLTRRADAMAEAARGARERGDALEARLRGERTPPPPVPPVTVALEPLLRDAGAGASVAATTGEVELRLRADAGRYPRFSVAMDGADGVAVWAGAGVREGGAVVARVPGALLPPGRYAVALSGVGLGAGPEILHRYAVRVTP